MKRLLAAGAVWGVIAVCIGSVVIGSLAQGFSRPPVPVYHPPVYQYQQFPYGYQQFPYGYHQETLYDQWCNCYKIVLVPN